MGDFVAPTAANGGSLCLSTNLGNAGNGNVNIPKHSTVVERLRQRIEGCRRHHVSCESRYQQAQAEQLEIERRDTVSLYQRTLEQRAKKSASGGGGGGSSKQSKQQQQEPDSGTAEQRNSTLIALQETVKRKLEVARSPLNGEQQNGVCDGSFSPTSKRVRKDGIGLDSINSLSSMPMPSVSPLHQMDIKPSLPLQNSGTHSSGLEDLGKNGGLPEIKLPVNGNVELDDGFNLLQSKDLKQEPLDDPAGIDPSDTSLSNQNKLFSDINLNDQEWQELIDELANTVPEDDMQDLFNEDFEEKKEPEFTRPTAQTPLPQDNASIKSDPAQSPFSQVPMGSPQVRPSSSGPPFSNVSTASNVYSVSSAPPAPMPASSPANYIVPSPQTPTQGQVQVQVQPQAQAQVPTRSGNGFLMNAPSSGPGPGPVPVPGADLSPAEQLKQLAAHQQQRAKLLQHKQQQQQQQQQQSQGSSWSPAGPPTSPFGGPFNAEKPKSPMMYPQAFNNQNPIAPPMASNPQKATMNNYLSQNHMSMMNQQPNNLGQNSLSKQPNMLSYSNTKPLSHFSAEPIGPRITPPMANPNKAPMMPYIQQQPQMQAQVPHMSEEQKRILLMKQKGLLNQSMSYGAMAPHSQEQNPIGISRTAGPVQPPVPGPGNVAPVPGSGSNPVAPSYLGNQQQAAMMKQMFFEQEKQRVHHLQMLEQQKQQQLLREQRQQQQQLLAEQLQQQHLSRQHPQQQRNPYPLQQVNQFQGSPQELAAARNQAALQNMRNSRIMQQNAGMMPMGPVQNPGTMPSATGQPEMGMTPYSNPQNNQQGMYSMSQMLQHPNQSGMNMAHNPSQGPRQPTAGQGVGMVGGFGQTMLVNSAMTQQHQQIKGTVAQALVKAQAPRLQNMMGNATQGAQGWQQQGLQGIPGRTSGEIGPFNNGSAYPMQPGQPRMAKQHFAQVLDASGSVRAMNPAMGGQMMHPLPGQPRTNQPRPMGMPGMGQGVPNLTSFNQATGQQLPGGPFTQSSQSQTYHRNASQDLTYSYGSQSAGGSFSGMSEGADLVDSIIKGGSPDEWMPEFGELFGNQ
ncbi:mastermind-like protein 3 isoform X2 [Latimeria chalumnae]|nr:PREDICTED: mastermind-like protein 3 isoform X2 [Latimeria chalumnae]|eukprot:XP_005996672.1 PREDICTED: mastermind-like protein 3 isoform X2 [Latimeria chalumnae]